MAKEKRIAHLFAEIPLAVFIGIAFCLVFCCAQECHRKHRVNNKRKHEHQMCTNVSVGTRFSTRISAKLVHPLCVCVGL